MAAIEDCIPHGKAESIDEVPCWLIGRERERDNAEAIAMRIKQRLIDEDLSPAIRCSIGIAPNRFLAKTASDMRKPDGLTVLEEGRSPRMRCTRWNCAISAGSGPSMEQRLRAPASAPRRSCAPPRASTCARPGAASKANATGCSCAATIAGRTERRASVGHSHVLGPELRSFEGARAVLFKLLAKAAMRLRHERHLAGGMAIRIRFVGLEKPDSSATSRSRRSTTRRRCCACSRENWRRSMKPIGQRGKSEAPSAAVRRRHPDPLEPVGSITEELMASRGRAKAMSATLDSINQRYGNNTLYFGAMQEALEQDAAPMRIPFAAIPQTALEEDVASRRPAESAEELWLQRERQFKVMAEAAHRKAQSLPSRAAARPASPYGAGGWTRGASSDEPEAPDGTGSLF